MAHVDFDEQDLEALRRLCSDDACGAKNNPRPTIAKRTTSTPVVQLNVRVRPEIGAKARQIAEISHCTLTDVIERAIEDLFARTERS